MDHQPDTNNDTRETFQHLQALYRLSVRIFEAANRQLDFKALLSELVDIIAQFSGCEAVGLRLLDEEGNIPYQGYTGFPQEFYNKENLLSVVSDECMCIDVVRGKTDPRLPFFTGAGSFFMNGTTEFLATVSEVDKGPTRNECNRYGYESVALIPIRQTEKIIGLIHLADKRKDVVPLDFVRLMEDIGLLMGSAIQRAAAEERVRESLREKEVLLREVHHRVKNNLAIISGLLNLERKTIDDPSAKEALTELGSRIKAMALIHEVLYRSERVSQINFEDYLKALISHLRMTYGLRSNIRIDICAAVEMNLDEAIPCGMIINELVTNSLKYAFPGYKPVSTQSCCEISIAVTWDGSFYTLRVADNRIGMSVDPEKAQTLGMKLVKMLGQHQLGGVIDMDHAQGTTFLLRFGPRHRN